MHEAPTLNTLTLIVQRAFAIRAKMHLLSRDTTDLPDSVEQNAITPTCWYQPARHASSESARQNWSKVELAPGRGSAYACSGRAE